MKKALLYGAKSREEANLIEQVIDRFTKQYYQDAHDLALKCPSLNWLILLYRKLNGENDLYEILKESANAGFLYAHGFAMTFLDIYNVPKEMTEIAAESGCPISQCLMYTKTKNRQWLEMAADLGYSKALYKLGRYREAAELGHPQAMLKYAEICTGQEHWYWIARAFQQDLVDYLDLYEMDNDAWCQLGAILRDHSIARPIYLEHCKKVRIAVDAWSICAKRMGICKDVRILIAKVIWEKRVFRLA